MRLHRLVLVCALLFVGSAFAAEVAMVKPKAEDKCPVCGMFVAKYPDFIAEITFKDGSYVVFDGVKDMMKYTFDMAKYTPGKQHGDMVSILVTDYYGLVPIAGDQAYYVVGSNVYGPMGKELIPFENEADAREFMVDHGGKQLLRYKDVNKQLVLDLD